MKKLLDKVGRKRPGGPSLVGKQIVIGSTCVRVESLLGEGGFGSIYRVREIYSGQLYAVKHLRLQGDQDAIQAVQQEARIMFKLKDHKHVLRLHAVAFGGEKGAETDGYMLLDYCPSTLISLLESYNFILDNALIMEVFVSVCEGVAHMHSMAQPLAHRDLKVENVLRLTDGTWVICDFGSATTRAQVYESQAEIANEEEVIRRTTTPAYRAPEMVDMLNRQRIDTKVDIWALGVMLYVLCFGKLPFQGDSKLQILYGRFEIPPGRPPLFRELINDMLTVKPDDRPDIHAVLAKARHYAATLGPAPAAQPAGIPFPVRNTSNSQRGSELVVVPSQNPPPDFQVAAPLMQQPRQMQPAQGVSHTQPGSTHPAFAQSPRVQQQNYSTVPPPAVSPMHQQQQQQQPRYQTLGPPVPSLRQSYATSHSPSPSRQLTGGAAAAAAGPPDLRTNSIGHLHTELPSSNGNASAGLDHSPRLARVSKSNVAAGTSSSSSPEDSPKAGVGISPRGPPTRAEQLAGARSNAGANASANVGPSGLGGVGPSNIGGSANDGYGSGFAAAIRASESGPLQRRLTGGMGSTNLASTRGSNTGEDWADFSNTVGKGGPNHSRKDAALGFATEGGTSLNSSNTRHASSPNLTASVDAPPIPSPKARSPSPQPATSAAHNIAIMDTINTLRDTMAGDIDAIRRQLKEVVVSNQSLTQRVKALEDTTSQQRQIISRLQSDLDAVRSSQQPTQTTQTTQQNHSRYSFHNQSDSATNNMGAPLRDGMQTPIDPPNRPGGGSYWSNTNLHKGIL